MIGNDRSAARSSRRRRRTARLEGERTMETAMAKDRTEKAGGDAESVTYIYIALAGDIIVAVAKLVVGLLAGSTAMLAEAAHSFADCTNQIFLLVGVSLSDRPADEGHPYGHGKERVFWAFLAAIFIFVSGAFFSLYEGIRGLLSGEAHHGSFLPAYIVLGFSLIFNVVVLIVTGREVRHRTRSLNVGLLQFVREEPAPVLKTTFYSEIAAVLGVVVAAVGLALVQATGNTVYDGAASVVIGLILIAVAISLVLDARNLILGAPAAPRTQRKIRDAIGEFPGVAIVELLTMRLGLKSVLVTGRIDISDELQTGEIEELLMRMERHIQDAVPEVKNLYLEPQSLPV